MPKDADEKPHCSERRCRKKDCHQYAIALEDYCWAHLEPMKQRAYRDKLQRWVKDGNTLDGENLSQLDLRHLDLQGANMRNSYQFNANYEGTTLTGADFTGANCIGVIFRKAYLSGVDFEDTNLSNAVFEGAYLLPSNFKNSNLQWAKFSNAVLMNTNLNEAKLRGVVWNDAREVYWEQIQTIGEEKDESWQEAQEGYCGLKQYFNSKGRYQDESKAYYREKLMAKKAAFAEKKVGRGILLALSQTLTGFGEHWWKTALWALGVVTLFAVIYGVGQAMGVFLFDFKPAMVPSIFQYFYLSVVTFATLGFGDITPLCWQAQIPVVVEVIFGYVFLGLIITIIARRFGR